MCTARKTTRWFQRFGGNVDDFSKIIPASRRMVPVPLLREMPELMRQNVAQAERAIPMAEDALMAASDNLIAWVQAMGEIERQERVKRKTQAAEAIVKHRSDRRHWLLQAQAWRNRLLRHPELAAKPIDVKCSCGNVAPMCDPPSVRSREPSDDDEDAA